MEQGLERELFNKVSVHVLWLLTIKAFTQCSVPELIRTYNGDIKSNKMEGNMKENTP